MYPPWKERGAVSDVGRARGAVLYVGRAGRCMPRGETGALPHINRAGNSFGQNGALLLTWVWLGAVSLVKGAGRFI